jgi:hypothetical protein
MSSPSIPVRLGRTPDSTEPMSWRRRIVPARLASVVFLLAISAACAASDEADAAAGADAADVTPETAAPAALAAPVQAAWIDRVWVRSDVADLPGSMRIFLSDGTLVMDSCWEVYRLSAWQQEGENGIVWFEDGQEIRAELLQATDEVLKLRLQLVDGPHEENYEPAEVPYVCPEMAR